MTTTVSIHMPEQSGQTGQALWLRKTSDGTVVNTGGDSLTEAPASSGRFIATVTEAWTELLHASVVKSALTVREGWLSVDATVVKDSYSHIDTSVTATLTDTDLANIVAGVQAVSAGIELAKSKCGLYITTGDTWIQDVENLGNLTGKTVAFAIKTNAGDTDANAIVYLDQTLGLTRLNSAAWATTTLGSITVLSTTEGNMPFSFLHLI